MLWLLLVLAILAQPLAADNAAVSAYFNTQEPPAANVSISAITISSQPLYVGASTDFLITLYNYGTLAANVSTNVSIFNATSGQVDFIAYDPVIVLPQSSSIISKTWSTGSNSVGIYSVNATASYNDGANITNTIEKSFSILEPPIIQPGGGRNDGGGGGGYVAPPGIPIQNGSKFVPIPIPPIGPVTTGIRFLKTTLLKEAGQGDSVFESFVMKNIGSGEKKVTFRVSGVPDDWLSYSPKEGVLLFAEERVLNLGLNIPSDALAGDYLIKIEAIEEKETAIDYMVLRVKEKTAKPVFPYVYKTVRLDRLKGNTEVTIDVQNGGAVPLSRIAVSDEILAQFKVTTDDLKFLNKPPKEIFDGNPILVRWEIVQLAPGEIARISYLVNSVLNEYRPYVYWTTKQIEVIPKDITPADLVSIKSITSTPVSEGGTTDVTAQVFYAGFDPIRFSAVLESSDGFEISPPSINDSLTPRGIKMLDYKVKTARNSAGTHTVNLNMLLEGGYLISGTGYINVEKPLALAISQVAFVIFAVIIIILGLLYFFGKKKDFHEKKRQVEMRSGYIDEIKRHIKSK